MDMKSDDVNNILQDISGFLFATLKNEHLSTKAKAEYDQLVQRLTSLLEPVVYTDMSGSIKHAQSEEYVAVDTSHGKNVDCKLYEEFPDSQIFNNSEPQESHLSISIEHLILPASKLRMVGKKFGALSRKERFMGFFAERSIRCYIGLLGHYLYIYNSDKDAKPAMFINIQGFEARPAVAYSPKDSKKRFFFFEVVCPGKKSYQFMASNLHEMEQWINCINEATAQGNETQEYENSPKNLASNSNKISASPSDLKDLEEYDDIQGNDYDRRKKIKEYSEENYYNIKDLGLINEQQIVSSVTTTEQFNTVSIKMSDNGTELVYDDICPVDPELYYNVNDQKVNSAFENDMSSKLTYDEDIYDDIGVLLNNAAVQYCNNLHTSNNKSNTTVQKRIFSEVITDVTDSGLKKSNCCADNLYEPVENPRDD